MLISESTTATNMDLMAHLVPPGLNSIDSTGPIYLPHAFVCLWATQIGRKGAFEAIELEKSTGLTSGIIQQRSLTLLYMNVVLPRRNIIQVLPDA